MPQTSEARTQSRCLNCGFETDNREDWDMVEAPPLGVVTQCPKCGSTDVTIVS